MIRRPPRSTRKESSAASDVYKRQILICVSSIITAISLIYYILLWILSTDHDMWPLHIGFSLVMHYFFAFFFVFYWLCGDKFEAVEIKVVSVLSGIFALIVLMVLGAHAPSFGEFFMNPIWIDALLHVVISILIALRAFDVVTKEEYQHVPIHEEYECQFTVVQLIAP
eukprot:TRINITY_DN8708_c0_g1_i11.p2 TRINITY_DN8708_c0_g1~~TRINITY_DN8708_c0_g1_i11.p2  ORF type:complete len:176 (+),score=42.42 TRINITY_DN8708_c0_g1_i11:26-529(+)